MKKTNLFTLLTKAIIIIMPFYVLLAVFGGNQLHIPAAGFFIKELLLLLIFLSLLYEYIKSKKFPRFGVIDYLIFAFITYGIIITLINGGGIKDIVVGGRYDFMFLIVFLIYRHSSDFLKTSPENLIKLFLYSGTLSLFFGILLKFMMGEEYLKLFGYVDYVGNWVYSGGVPNYHGLEGTRIRRFQGILDGPNAMAYFLIIFGGLFVTIQKNKKEYYVWAVLAFILLGIILTFSRSALLGVAVGVGLLSLYYINDLYKKHKKTFLYSGIIVAIIGVFSVVIFQEPLKNIFLRHGSTSGHFERMETGIKRFTTHPLGAGLAEAGPGYRIIHPDKQTKEDEVYYIPESWYIQLLIEGGIIYLGLFLAILFLIAKKLFVVSKSVFVLFIAILVMNIFLHIFEASYLSILFFLFIGLFYTPHYDKKVSS